MPEVSFTFRWPNGAAQRGFSPSRTIESALVAGAAYPVAEFVRRTSVALEAGSERLRGLRGFACSGAAASIEAISERAALFGADELVTVERVERAPTPRRFPAPERLGGHRTAVVIGGGQAGLSASAALNEQGVDHVVLERDRVGAEWRARRWDTFCLVTPNWQCRLPGMHYDGDDPTGFMVKDEILAFLDRYAADVDPPLCEGVEVRSVLRARGVLEVHTSHGKLTADHVVLAVGGYHVPRVPAMAFGDGVSQLHSSAYRNPPSLPDGGVLVVGSGQSGAQIAEDLFLAGREVHLAVGSAPRVARCYRGRDCVAWLDDIGHYRMTIDDHPEGPGARREPNHYVTGRGGGHDIDLRAFATQGMRLHGRLLGVDDGVLRFAGDLERNLDAADATADRIKDTIDRHIAAAGVDAPVEARYVPVWRPESDGSAPVDLAAAGIRTVVWATGFTPDWSWVDLPAFAGPGHPEHTRGHTVEEGVHVLGLPWLYTWGSGRFASIAEDARHVAQGIAGVRAGARIAA
ncbi:MAG: putative flavoprotein involved in transport [Solirubrobacteraceae bacterium]|jgi:putative flavoprotein involved in K+ transport|nr:putative flavoprotein involved in transport [Solirubrobacteraceae bacterium]